MSTSLTRQQHLLTNRVFTALAVMSLLGFVLLGLTAFVGFEEPNSTLLLTSLALVFATPVAMLAHLVRTKELTRSEKRIWIRELAGPRFARTFSEYLTSPNRSETAERLAAEASGRLKT